MTKKTVYIAANGAQFDSQVEAEQEERRHQLFLYIKSQATFGLRDEILRDIIDIIDNNYTLIKK